ncbi:MAG: hypothetical protein H0X64_13140 [Gemmatimonadaceae bacterium]|nr:hypothetical protein [Gemmatimonadaceae bacterium]
MTAPQVFLTETRERFLKAVIAELPPKRIRELYLFAPIKQGGVESGVAVIAATAEDRESLPVDGAPIADSAEMPAIDAESKAGNVEIPAIDAESKAGNVEMPPIDAESTADNPDLPAIDPESTASNVDLPAIDPESTASNVEMPAIVAEPTADNVEMPAIDCAPTARNTDTIRYTVYTARYRHTLKGPDRGKWDASIVAEADAPLLSIETVVRGVQRRSGDVDPPDRMTGDELRAALRLAPPAGDA